jgi:pectinesterase inhibitor-like protein
MKSCVGNRTMSNLLPSNLDPGAAHIVIGPSLLSLSINKRSKERDGEAAKMAMAYVAAAVLAAVTLTASFAGGEACNFVASMTWTAACQQTGRWENLCQQTLQTAPATAEVTVYALVATRLAKLRYENTLGEVDTMLWPRNAPADARAALDNCKYKYSVALGRMDAVSDEIFACDFSHARQEYVDAEVAVRSCQDGLLRLPNQYHSWPLFAKVSADYDLTMVAYLLGAIFLGR